ncbi:hypothetical protein FWH58_01730, partial [Candidatus Saccharibacteria bacterium]|nr:hypothetical protein [Candidatus Saccharibacteria bacterium]
MFNHQPAPSVISSAHSNEFRVKTFLSENQNQHSPSLGEPDFQSKKSFRKFGEVAKENNAEKTTAKSFQASLTSASMPGLAPNRQTV